MRTTNPRNPDMIGNIEFTKILIEEMLGYDVFNEEILRELSNQKIRDLNGIEKGVKELRQDVLKQIEEMGEGELEVFHDRLSKELQKYQRATNTQSQENSSRLRREDFSTSSIRAIENFVRVLLLTQIAISVTRNPLLEARVESDERHINPNLGIVAKSLGNGVSDVSDSKTAISTKQLYLFGYPIGASAASVNTGSKQPLKLDELFNAILQESTKKVKLILGEIKNNPKLLEKLLTQADKNGDTALLYAADLGKNEIVKEILNVAKSKEGLLEKILSHVEKKAERSPLVAACIKGQLGVVKLILDEVKNNPKLLEKLLTQADKSGGTALIIAAFFNTEIAKEILNVAKRHEGLLEKILSNTEKSFGKSPLIVACIKGQLGVVKLILDEVKNNPKLLEKLLTQADKSGGTALLFAANLDNTEIAKEILNVAKRHEGLPEKVLLQATGQFKQSPLIVACSKGQLEVVKLILDEVKNNPELLKKLLTQADKNGDTALFYAADLGNTEIVKEILNVAKSKEGLLEKVLLQNTGQFKQSPLSLACFKGQLGVVKPILDEVKNNSKLLEKLLTQADKNGKAALLYAADLGNTEIVKEILSSVKDKPELKQILLKQTEVDAKIYKVVLSSLKELGMSSEIITAAEQDEYSSDQSSSFLQRIRDNSYTPLILASVLPAIATISYFRSRKTESEEEKFLNNYLKEVIDDLVSGQKNSNFELGKATQNKAYKIFYDLGSGNLKTNEEFAKQLTIHLADNIPANLKKGKTRDEISKIVNDFLSSSDSKKQGSRLKAIEDIRAEIEQAEVAKSKGVTKVASDGCLAFLQSFDITKKFEELSSDEVRWFRKLDASSVIFSSAQELLEYQFKSIFTDNAKDLSRSVRARLPDKEFAFSEFCKTIKKDDTEMQSSITKLDQYLSNVIARKSLDEKFAELVKDKSFLRSLIDRSDEEFKQKVGNYLRRGIEDSKLKPIDDNLVDDFLRAVIPNASSGLSDQDRLALIRVNIQDLQWKDNELDREAKVINDVSNAIVLEIFVNCQESRRKEQIEPKDKKAWDSFRKKVEEEVKSFVQKKYDSSQFEFNDVTLSDDLVKKLASEVGARTLKVTNNASTILQNANPSYAGVSLAKNIYEPKVEVSVAEDGRSNTANDSSGDLEYDGAAAAGEEGDQQSRNDLQQQSIVVQKFKDASLSLLTDLQERLEDIKADDHKSIIDKFLTLRSELSYVARMIEKLANSDKAQCRDNFLRNFNHGFEGGKNLPEGADMDSLYLDLNNIACQVLQNLEKAQLAESRDDLKNSILAIPKILNSKPDDRTTKQGILFFARGSVRSVVDQGVEDKIYTSVEISSIKDKIANLPKNQIRGDNLLDFVGKVVSVCKLLNTPNNLSIMKYFKSATFIEAMANIAVGNDNESSKRLLSDLSRIREFLQNKSNEIDVTNVDSKFNEIDNLTFRRGDYNQDATDLTKGIILSKFESDSQSFEKMSPSQKTILAFSLGQLYQNIKPQERSGSLMGIDDKDNLESLKSFRNRLIHDGDTKMNERQQQALQKFITTIITKKQKIPATVVQSESVTKITKPPEQGRNA